MALCNINLENTFLQILSFNVEMIRDNGNQSITTIWDMIFLLHKNHSTKKKLNEYNNVHK